MEQLKYLPINTGVRAAKIVVLVDVKSKYWETDCLAVIALFSRIWGGGSNLIIPTDGYHISDEFWGILKRFDPDYVYYYKSTTAQLKEFDNIEYKKLKEKYIESNNITLTCEIDDFLMPNSNLTDFKIDESLQHSIISRLNLFEVNKVQPILRLEYQDEMRYPLTDIRNMSKSSINEKNEPELDSITSLSYSEEDNILNLLLHSNYGLIDKYTDKILEGKNILNDCRYSNGNNKYLLLNSIYEIYSPFRRKEYGFKLSDLNLVELSGINAFEEDDTPVYIVGDSLSDFCLYYCLSRLKMKIYWFPKTNAVNIHSIFELKNERLDEFKTIKVTSASLNETDAMKIINKMSGSSQKLNFHFFNDYEFMLENIIYSYNKDNYINEQVLLFDPVSNNSIFPIETPIPKYFLKVPPSNHYWITDVNVKGILFPKQQHLVSNIIRHHNYNKRNVRISDNGLSYLSPNYYYFNGMSDNVELTKINPYFHYPNIELYYNRIFENAKLTIKMSDKGKYKLALVKMFGGLEKTADRLLKEDYRILFEKFVDLSGGKPGVYTNGVLINKRRYLDFDSVLFLYDNNTEKATAIMNDLMVQNVLEGGFIFKCTECRNVDWYKVSEVNNTFKCKRCDKVQIYNTESLQLQPINNRFQPQWFYKLNEMAFAAYHHNSSVPILTLYKLKNESKESFQYIPEVEVRSNKDSSKPDMEIDIACVIDGYIVIGECKSGTVLKDTKDNGSTDEKVVKKYLKLAKKIGAHKLVFSTTQNWNANTLALLEKYKKQEVDIEIIIYQKIDLFTED